jgi:hypothetical protein
MDKQEGRDIALTSAITRHTLAEWTATWPPDLLAGFSERECQHLIFLRWLYRQGYLTEWNRD